LIPTRYEMTGKLLLAFGVLFVTPSVAGATLMVLTNPNQFSPASTLITFDEGDFNGHLLAAFEVVPSYRGIGFLAFSAPVNTQPTVAFDPTPPRQFGPGGTAGKRILQYFPSATPAQGLQITLPQPATQFGAEFESVTSGNYTFTVLMGDQPIDS